MGAVVLRRSSMTGRGGLPNPLVDLHDGFQRRHLSDDIDQFRGRFKALSAVVVPRHTEQHDRFYLAEPVEHSVDAKIGRHRRKGRSDCPSAQHRDDRFGAIGRNCCHPVARNNTHAGEPGRDPSNLIPQLGPTERRTGTGLVHRHDRDVVGISRRKEDRRHIEPSIGKETRGVPRFTRLDDPVASRTGNVEEVPERPPKLGRFGNRKRVKVLVDPVRLPVETAATCEGRQMRVGDKLR